MRIVNIFDIEGTDFPAGRKTRIMVGEKGAIKISDFAQGYVTIYPGGSVPAHNHKNVETYTILEGTGMMRVDGKESPVKKGDCILVESGKEHNLTNTGKDNMIMMFVYAPGSVVDHWEAELSGDIK